MREELEGVTLRDSGTTVGRHDDRRRGAGGRIYRKINERRLRLHAGVVAGDDEELERVGVIGVWCDGRVIKRAEIINESIKIARGGLADAGAGAGDVDAIGEEKFYARDGESGISGSDRSHEVGGREGLQAQARDGVDGDAGNNRRRCSKRGDINVGCAGSSTE